MPLLTFHSKSITLLKEMSYTTTTTFGYGVEIEENPEDNDRYPSDSQYLLCISGNSVLGEERYFAVIPSTCYSVTSDNVTEIPSYLIWPGSEEEMQKLINELNHLGIKPKDGYWNWEWRLMSYYW